MLLKTSHFASLERSFCGLQDFTLLWWQYFQKHASDSKFLSFYLLHYLHCHFACQYKRGNCCQMTCGWYLTLSCLSLVCSATFLTFHFPLSLVLYSSCTWHLSWALSVMSIIIINKVPPLCQNHAKSCSSYVKQFAASLMNWLGFTFLLHLT